MSHPEPWHSWYGLARWRKRHRAQLLREPLCRMCIDRGLVVPASVADHIERHRGNWNQFMLGALQSLCKPCHDGRKRLIERRGYAPDIGVDGYPLDPRHPAYR